MLKRTSRKNSDFHVDVMKYIQQKNLNRLLDECRKCLLSESRRNAINYNSHTGQNWEGGKYATDNEAFLKSVRGKANVYMIFTSQANCEDKFELQYIGQTLASEARKRLRCHLFKSGPKLVRC